jgi:hypothetical protein
MNHAPGIINLDPCPVHLVDTSTPPMAPPGTLHEPTLRAVIEAIAETQSRKEAIALIESLAGRAMKSLDDPHLQQLFGDAIEGALALGFQGTNAPPPGHWLQRFWDIGRAEATKAAPAAIAVSEAVTDEQVVEVAARLGSLSLHVTRMHQLGGKTSTILEEEGVIEFGRGILALVQPSPVLSKGGA